MSLTDVPIRQINKNAMLEALPAACPLPVLRYLRQILRGCG